MYLRCIDQEILTTDTRQCDNGKEIPLNQWCNGTPQCEDGSDESDRHCKGESNNSVAFGLLGFFLVGIALVGPTLFCFFKKNRRHNIRERESPAINPIVSKYLNEDIIQVFLKKRNFEQELSEVEEMILKSHYLKMRDQGIECCYFDLLKKSSADPATSEKCIMLAYNLEVEYQNCDTEDKHVVFKHWSQSMSHKVELKAWVFSHVSQGFGYKLGRFFYICAIPLHYTYEYFDRHVLSNLLAMYKLTMAFVDLWKDLIISIAFLTFSQLKLVSTNQTIF